MRTARFAAAALVAVFLVAAGLLGVRGEAVQRAADDHTFGNPALLSGPEYDVRIDHNVRVRMRDGIELSADIYRPDHEGRYPALLLRTPYGKDPSVSMSAGAYDPRFYAERGYAVVVQDCRGRFDSEGEFEPFVDEGRDGYDTHEWIGRQPWSNGRIGGLGQSYFGLTQLFPAIEGSRFLTTVVPVMTTADTFNNWIYQDGAFFLSFALGWGTGLETNSTASQDATQGGERPEGTAATAHAHLPLIEADIAMRGRPISHYRDWMSHPTKDSYWTDRSPTEQLTEVTVPALFFTGWYDFFLKGALGDFERIKGAARSDLARRGTQLIIGPWAHYTGPEGAARQVGDRDFGPSAAVDLAAVQLRWYDYWLKGVSNGADADAPVRIFVMGENRWRAEQEWPLARTHYTKYYFHSHGKANSSEGDGLLTVERPGLGGGEDVFVYDPSDPVPSIGGATFGAVGPGPYDQRPVEQRQDVLVYSTPPLREPIEVTGPISVTLYATTTAPDTDFTAKLVDVRPDGYAQILQDGIVRARSQQPNSALIQPGRTYEYGIDLWATSNVFQVGHRIRVELSSSDFPHFDRNLNTGDPPAQATNPIKATQTIYHDAERSSHITLPIIPRP